MTQLGRNDFNLGLGPHGQDTNFVYGPKYYAAEAAARKPPETPPSKKRVRSGWAAPGTERFPGVFYDLFEIVAFFSCLKGC